MGNIFIIKDSNGRFEGRIKIYSMEEKSDWKWAYISDKFAISGNLIRENAELKVMKLRELNAVAGFDNLDWEVIEVSENEYLDTLCFCNLSVEWEDVKNGYIGKSRKFVRNIYRKYDGLMKKMV